MAEQSNVVELPASSESRWRKRLLWGGAGVLVFVLVLIGVLLYTPVLAIKHVEITGNKLATTASIQEDLEQLHGVPLPRVAPGKVRDLLAEQPAVEDVVIQAEAPDTLRVEIIEYPPVAVAKSGGSHWLVAADGRKLRRIVDRSAYELPLISEVSADAKPELFETITHVLSALPAEVLAQLEFATAETIDSVELELASGERVRWGSDERGDEKSAVLTALLGAEQPENQPAVKVYDVSSPERPVTR
ncbi:hypothetical protein GCM10027591_15670 [Zhihengliuella somnathii]